MIETKSVIICIVVQWTGISQHFLRCLVLSRNNPFTGPMLTSRTMVSLGHNELIWKQPYYGAIIEIWHDEAKYPSDSYCSGNLWVFAHMKEICSLKLSFLSIQTPRFFMWSAKKKTKKTTTSVSSTVTQQSSCDSLLDTSIAWNLAGFATREGFFLLLNQFNRELISLFNTRRIWSAEVPANEVTLSSA